jgi:hypothetical protein
MELPQRLTEPEFVRRLPPFLARFVSKSPMERSRQLATEFHRVEDAERRRLEDVMAWHTSTSGEQRHRTSSPERGNYHPLSISAGVEKGHLNRYRNIFPVSASAPIYVIDSNLTLFSSTTKLGVDCRDPTTTTSMRPTLHYMAATSLTLHRKAR